MQPATEADLAHFADIMEMLKERWSTMPQEAKDKMAAARANPDPSAQEARVAEFMANWNGCDANADGKLSQAEFGQFTQNQLNTTKTNLGWAPEFSEDVANQMFAAISALNPAETDIGMAEYGRFAACMQKMMEDNQ